MTMTIIGFALVLLGAVSNFGSSKILGLFLSKEKVVDKHILAMKLASMVVVVIGVILVFVYGK